MAVIQHFGASRDGEQGAAENDWLSPACRSVRRSLLAAGPHQSGKVIAQSPGNAMNRSTAGKDQHLLQILRQMPLSVQTLS